MNWRRAFEILVLVAALILFFTTALRIDFDRVESFLKSSGWMAPVLFSALMIVGILVAPIPTSPLTLMSPRLFGVWSGLLLTLTSATVGAAIAFLIARKLGSRFLARFPQYRRLQHLLPPGATAFAVFLLRLPPSPTFDAVSYLAGLTPMPLWEFLLATFLGMIPVTATLCFAGALVPKVWLWPLLAALLGISLLRLFRGRFGIRR